MGNPAGTWNATSTYFRTLVSQCGNYLPLRNTCAGSSRSGMPDADILPVRRRRCKTKSPREIGIGYGGCMKLGKRSCFRCWRWLPCWAGPDVEGAVRRLPYSSAVLAVPRGEPRPPVQLAGRELTQGRRKYRRFSVLRRQQQYLGASLSTTGTFTAHILHSADASQQCGQRHGHREQEISCTCRKTIP